MAFKTQVQFLILSLLTTVLTATVLFMAPITARTLWQRYGRLSFWSFAVMSSVALFWIVPQWAFAQAVVFLLVGIYAELEHNKASRFLSAATSVGVTALAGFFMISVWAQSQKMSLMVFLKKGFVEKILQTEQLKALPIAVTAEQILVMLPAFAGIMLMILLFFSIAFERTKIRREKITSFKVPDNLVWVLIASLALAFLVDVKKAYYLQAVANNVLYLTLAAYYFQGLAIVGYFFQRFRVHYFIKAGLFFILAFHLFAFVAVFGLSDVWFSYRSKVYKKLIKNNPYAGD